MFIRTRGYFHGAFQRNCSDKIVLSDSILVKSSFKFSFLAITELKAISKEFRG